MADLKSKRIILKPKKPNGFKKSEGLFSKPKKPDKEEDKEKDIEKDIEAEEDKEKASQEENSAAANHEIKNIYEYYEKNITTLSDEEKEKLQSYSKNMSLDVIRAIIQEAIKSNGKSWKYVDAILSACNRSKIFTIEQFQKRQEEFQKHKTKKEKKIYNNYDQRDMDNVDLDKFLANIPTGEET